MKRKEGVFVVAQAAIFVGVIALVALPLQSASNTQVSTSSTVREGPLVFASGVASDGLQLKMVLNSTSMRSDGAITGNLTVVNTSDQNITVSPLTQSLNLTYWSDYIGTCGSDYWIGGYAVFQGHFNAGNISSAGWPLRLWPSLAGSCPGGNSFEGVVTFLSAGAQGVGRATVPDSGFRDQLNVTSGVCAGTSGYSCGVMCQTTNVNGCAYSSSFPGLVGYWNNSSSTFMSFSPGEYTIFAWDDWNQYVYATFVVQPGESSQTSSATSDVTACGVGNQVITLNKTAYCADDVANDTVVGGPGYSYFLNGTITYLGVTFEPYCPSIYRGCPGANSSASMVMLGIMRFTMTFPDNTNETGSSVIEDGYYAQILSNHSDPRAGMLIEITYGAHATTHVYLLVEKP